MLPSTFDEGRIGASFQKLHERKEGALIAYLTGGDPEQRGFLANAGALIEGGADILEVGIPFSDPIADGPVIQASSMRALASGTTPRKVLGMIRELSDVYDVPRVVLTYYNPVLAMGVDKFLRIAHRSGVDGLVVPDLPVEESGDFREAASENGVDTIFLSAPNTSNRRLRSILENSSGFLYLVSLYGVTGPRQTLSEHAVGLVKRVKSLSNGRVPIAAGFGISKPEHVTSLINAGADGAIVGSKLVEIVGKHLGESDEAADYLKRAVVGLKRGTRP